MYELKNVNIEYHKLVLHSNSILFGDGINVIVGESGSGKTSLLECLNLSKKMFEQCVYNRKLIEDYDTFRKEHIAFLTQKPTLVESLTIKHHIKLMEELELTNNKNEMVERLNVNNLLDKYPNQLSDGEKVRVGLLLTLMKGADIVLLDEPTASLDIQNINAVMDIINEYAKDHIVIIASHDNEVIKRATSVYRIINNEVVFEIDKFQNIVKANNKILRKIPSLSLSVYLKQKNGLFNIVISAFLILSILLTSCGLSTLMLEKSLNNKQFKTIYNDEILIYKNPVPDALGYTLRGTGREYPITDGELNMIKEIENIEEIQYAYFVGSGSNLLELDNSLDYDEQDLYKLSILNGNKEEVISIDVNESSYYNNLLRTTYKNTTDYSEFIDVEFQKDSEGIYISQYLAEVIGLENIGEKAYARFVLPIPTHIGYGDAKITFDDVNYYPVACLLGKKIEVVLPINGILKGSTMGIGINNDLTIYLSDDYVQEYLEKYKSNETYTYYHSNETGYYQLNLNQNDSSSNEMICRPFEPTVYKVKIKSLTYVNSVSDIITSKGFSVIRDGIPQTLINYSSNTRNMILIASLCFYIVVTIFYGVMKHLNKNETIQQRGFFSSLGYSIKDIENNILGQYTFECIFGWLICASIGLLYLYVFGEYINYPIPITNSFIYFSLVLSFITFLLIPVIIYKLTKGKFL